MWDTGEAPPKYTYQEINPNTAENLDVKISSRAIGTGAGANVVTITLKETGGVINIPSALVSVRDITDTTLLTTATTNASGQVIFALNNGTYNVHKNKLGSHSFTNPETLTVAGNTSITYIGTSISVSAPLQANTCRMFIWIKNPDATLVTTLLGTLTIIALPYEYSGAFFLGSTITMTKHVDGYWYGDIVYGATIIIDIVSPNVKIQTIVPSQTTKDISTLSP